MPEALPEALREADAALHAVTVRLRFSAHLNPTNIAEARAAFAEGAEAPPFTYAPATWADDALAALRRVRIPTTHPLGQVLDASRSETAAWITALKERTPAAFDALAERCGWSLAADAPAPLPTPSNVATPRVPAETLITALRAALRARGFEGWTLVRDEVMSARVLVDASKREIRVHPGAVFREADLASLVAHEIDVHAVRGENGMRQPLRIFADGLPGALVTEEGLAMLAEERIGTLSPAFEARQLMLAEAIHHARTDGFRAVFSRLRERVGADAAFQMALRVKRGLADPGGPGTYAKDGVYLHGWRRVRSWLAEGGDIGLLYVGKVGLEHPVADWLARGWVRTGPVPKLWDGVGGALARGLLRAEQPTRPVALRVAR